LRTFRFNCKQASPCVKQAMSGRGGKDLSSERMSSIDRPRNWKSDRSSFPAEPFLFVSAFSPYHSNRYGTERRIRKAPGMNRLHCVAEGFPVASDSLAIATGRARICAASVVHSLQMKTLLLSPLSGFRRARKPSQPPHPPKRIRTSGRDLPQKEQVVHGPVIVVVSAVSSFFAELSTPLSEGAGTSSVLELDVSVVGDAVSGRRVRVCRSSSAGNLRRRRHRINHDGSFLSLEICRVERRTKAVCDRIGTPVRPSPCHKRSYVNVGQGHGEFTRDLFRRAEFIQALCAWIINAWIAHFVLIRSVLGFLGVAFGAFGAH
jgi:hypothetical protein